MDFAFSPRVQELQARLSGFMRDYVHTHLARYRREAASEPYPPPVLRELKALAKSEGLWNLFLPALRDDEPGTRLSNLEYAPLAEITGAIHWAPEIFNCNAPDTGNMELLHLFATPAQRETWLKPLLEGEIRSCFAMTEPDVASSDATNVTTSIRREGDDYVINGRKWFITGAARADCRLCIVMGKTDFDAEPHRQQSMVLVPMDAPGLTVVRDVTVLGHHSPEGHCELVFRDVRVPVENRLGEEGSGFALAQARLGPGRIHHCMRSLGAAELALALMCERALERKAFGRRLADFANNQDAIARSRIEIDSARLLVLKAAWLIDEHGAKAAAREIAMIKVLVPQVHTAVCDRAMQIFGAMGLSGDTPLAEHFAWGRALRVIDGPDEVHLRTIARQELKRETRGASATFLTPPLR